MIPSKYFIRFKGRKIYLFEDNVRTNCQNCGKEHVVDIVDVASTDGFDLYDSAAYCEECSLEARRRMQNMPGRYIPVADLGMK